MFDPSTVQCSDEITKDRKTDIDLRNIWLWTANTALYRIEDSEAVLYFSRGDTSRRANPILKNLDEAKTQLLNTQNYRPSQEDIAAVVGSVETGETTRFKLSDLSLQRHDDEFSYFEIDTENYNNLNETQRQFAEMVYGSGDDFKEAMNTLRTSKQKIKTTRIYVLNEDYVKNKVKGDEAVARACRLNDFDCYSDFNAGGRGVDNAYCSLRGVPKVGEADAQKIKDFYALLEQNPAAVKLAESILNEKTASIVLSMGSSYFTQAK